MTREFSIGRVSNDFVAILRRQWLALGLVCIVMGIAPMVLTFAWLKLQGLDGVQAQGWPLLVGALGSRLFTALLTTGLLVVALRDRQSLPGDTIGLSAAVLPAVLVLVILREAPQMAIAIPFYLYRDEMIATMSGYMTLATLSGLWVAAFNVLLVAAIPAAVGERLGPLTAIARGFRLARGRRWLLLGVILVADVGLSALQWIGGKIGSLLSTDTTAAFALLARVFTISVGIGVRALLVIVMAVLFLELRRLVDPPSLDDAAAAFD